MQILINSYITRELDGYNPDTDTPTYGANQQYYCVSNEPEPRLYRRGFDNPGRAATWARANCPGCEIVHAYRHEPPIVLEG